MKNIHAGVCPGCGVTPRPEGGYLESARRRGKDVVLHRSMCVACRNRIDRQYYWKNKEHCCEIGKRYRRAHPEQCRRFAREFWNRNAEACRESSREWARNNRDSINARRRKYTEESPQYCISNRVRSRLNSALRSAKQNKPARTVEVLGCTWDEFVLYLESKFLPGMTWENRSLWHIDHRIPLAWLDLSDPFQFKIGCHYTNLRPLWRHDNLRKGARWI